MMEGRRNNFDFLRFMLATLVIWSHSYPLFYGKEGEVREFIEQIAHQNISGGGLAVDGFFAISGLLIAASWERSRGFFSYLRKRVLRIYPGWIVAWLFCLLVVAPLSVDDRASFRHWVSLRYVIVHILNLGDITIPGAFAHLPLPRAIDGSMWTVRFEFFCYLLLAVLGIGGILRRRWGIVAVFVLCYAVYLLQVRHILFSAYYPVPGLGDVSAYPRLLTFFASGVVFYAWRDRVPFSRSLLSLSLLLLVAVLVLKWHPDYVLPICGVYTLFYFAYSPRVRLHNFGRYGDFSYGLYLYAFPIQQLLVQHYRASLEPWSLFLSAFGITFAFAVASWYAVERPFLRLKKRGEVQAGEAVPADGPMSRVPAV